MCTRFYKYNRVGFIVWYKCIHSLQLLYLFRSSIGIYSILDKYDIFIYFLQCTMVVLRVTLKCVYHFQIKFASIENRFKSTLFCVQVIRCHRDVNIPKIPIGRHTPTCDIHISVHQFENIGIAFAWRFLLSYMQRRFVRILYFSFIFRPISRQMLLLLNISVRIIMC